MVLYVFLLFFDGGGVVGEAAAAAVTKRVSGDGLLAFLREFRSDAYGRWLYFDSLLSRHRCVSEDNKFFLLWLPWSEAQGEVTKCIVSCPVFVQILDYYALRSTPDAVHGVLETEENSLYSDIMSHEASSIVR